jgi:cytochrome b
MLPVAKSTRGAAMNSDASYQFQQHTVWDRAVRCFHWVNVLSILGLIAVGVVILNAKILGVHSDGKILLKTIHVYIGYVFFFNLLWRIIWGFVGNQYARWHSVFYFGRKFRLQLAAHIAGVKKGVVPVYLGHNPLGKMMVAVLYLQISIQALTGLVLAGTDLYMPPFGHEMAEWVTGAGEDHSLIKDIKPYSKEGIQPEAYEEMREFRKPFITLHVYNFYLLLLTIALHIGGVVFSELKERSGLVSAMFTGRKFLSGRPADLED